MCSFGRRYNISTKIGNAAGVFGTTVTQYEIVRPHKISNSVLQRRARLRFGTVLAVAVAALVAVGWWLGAGFLKSSPDLTQKAHEMSPAQHTQQLIRMMRISAASDTTLPTTESIPDTVAGAERLECGTRFANGVHDAVIQLHGVEYLSSVAGARGADQHVWRNQQAAARDALQALQAIFPVECAPQPPVTFELLDAVRFDDAVEIGTMLPLSTELVGTWSELYLGAETSQEQDLALAGLWQVISWESTWHPGRSPFSLSF